jgi:hypothetical protein
MRKVIRIISSAILMLLTFCTNTWGGIPISNSSKTETTESTQQQFVSDVQDMAEMEAVMENFDFTGDWDCPNLTTGMNICMTIIHNTHNNKVKVDYLVNYRLWTYDNAIGWVEGNTIHIIQTPDDKGNYIEITATPISKKTIKGLLKYKNPYGKYNGKLIMNCQNSN